MSDLFLFLGCSKLLIFLIHKLDCCKCQEARVVDQVVNLSLIEGVVHEDSALGILIDLLGCLELPKFLPLSLTAGIRLAHRVESSRGRCSDVKNVTNLFLRTTNCT